MMSLIRRHQRAITIAVTFCTISTFVFFGSARAIAPAIQAPDVSVWHTGTIDLSSKQLALRARFLASEMPGNPKNPETWCAWMNPGFVTQWILERGLGTQMIESNSVFKEYLESRKAKERQWQGYKHPVLGYLNYEAVLSQFNPPLAQALKAWQSDSDASAATKIALYNRANRMPIDFYSTIIRYQEASLPDSQKDQRLADYPMSLFGYDSIKDWFGQDFVESCVKLVALGAQEAKDLGYHVAQEEVRRSIHSRVEQLWMQLQEKGMDLPLHSFKARMFGSIGMEEDDLVEFWKELILFDCFYHHQGSQILTDPLAIEKMASFVGESREIELYEIPKMYQTSSFEAMAKLQLYWHYTTGIGLTDSVVPTRMRSLSDIAQSAPELMAKKVSLSWRKMTLDDFCAWIGPKKMIIMESQDQLWSEISAQITNQKIDDVQERVRLLSKLDRNARERVDQVSLKWLLKNDPKNLMQAYESAPVENQVLSLALASTKQPLEGISNVNLLLKELENPVSDRPYTQDGMNYYLFEMTQPSCDEVIDFAKAQELSLLEILLSKKIKNHYEAMKTRQVPALYKEGKLLELSRARSQVLMDLFQPLLVELQNQMADLTSQPAKSQIYKLNEANDIAKWRYVAFLQKAPAETEEGLALALAPWVPVKLVKNFHRSDVLRTPLGQIFELSKDQWTQIELNNPLLYQRAKLLEVKLPQTEDQAAFWRLADQTQGTLDQQVSEEYVRKWAAFHEKEWAPEKEPQAPPVQVSKNL